MELRKERIGKQGQNKEKAERLRTEDRENSEIGINEIVRNRQKKEERETIYF